jgi:hypothetical protein
VTNPEPLTWRKSSRCGNTTCVEVAADAGTVWMRDGKTPDQKPLQFSHSEWRAFTDSLRAGDFDPTGQ